MTPKREVHFLYRLLLTQHNYNPAETGKRDSDLLYDVVLMCSLKYQKQKLLFYFPLLLFLWGIYWYHQQAFKESVYSFTPYYYHMYTHEVSLSKNQTPNG